MIEAEELIRFTVVVRPQRAEAIFRQLSEVPELTSLLAWEARGVGTTNTEGRSVFGLLPKVVIEGYAPVDLQALITQTIMSYARAGRAGDGKIFIQKITALA